MLLRSHSSSSLLPLDLDLERNLRKQKRRNQDQESDMDQFGNPNAHQGDHVAGNNGQGEHSGVQQPGVGGRVYRSIMDYGAPNHEGMPSSIRMPVIDAEKL